MSVHYPLPQLRRHSTRRDPLGLTVRERQVAEFLCWYNTPATAAALGITPATVARHRKNIFRKLRIINRHELRARLGFHELSEPFSEEIAP